LGTDGARSCETATEVVVIGGSPDGLNINAGVGSTYLSGLREAVVAEQADLGIAHDGDADRALFADARGNVIDGDQVLASCAIAMHERGSLVGDLVVTTVMANLGFHRAMREAGVHVVATQVGDRYVLEAMRADWPAAGDTVLRVDGGMTASDVTMQFLADVLDAPVDRPTCHDMR